MKTINVSNLPYRDDIVLLNEQGVFYEQPQSEAEKSWEKYILNNQNKDNEQNKIKDKAEFNNFINMAKQENELALVTSDLCKKGILKEVEVTESSEDYGNIKNFIIKEVRKIASLRLKELNENVEEEKRVYEEIKNLPYECKLEDGQLKIFTSPYNFLCYCNNNFSTDFKTNGLVCEIHFKDIVLKGFYKPEIKNIFEDLEFFDVENKIKGTFIHNNIKVVISEEKQENIINLDNEICKCLLSELYYGGEIQQLICQIPIFISRYFLNKLILDETIKEIIKIKSSEVFHDNLSSLFYVVTENNVYKVERSLSDFKIFKNGKLIKKVF